MLSRIFSLFVCAAVLAGPARLSAAYNPAVVAADARWLIYADFNALRDSALGKDLIGMVETHMKGETGPVSVNLNRLMHTIGLVTAYGTNLAPDPEAIDGALIAQGTPELRKIAESLLLQGTLAEPKVFSEVKDLPYPTYAINEPPRQDGKGTPMQLFVAFPPEPVVLASKSRAQLLKAREVFRGAAPSLAQAKDSPLTTLTAGAGDMFLLAASVVPTEQVFPQNAPQARLLQLTNSASLGFGERGPDTFARAELIASSDANAERVAKILQGLAAMLALAESNNRQVADFMNATVVSHDKNRVTLQLAHNTARLIQMTQNLRTQNEPRPAVRQSAPIASGKVLAEWTAADPATADTAGEGQLSWRTIENVQLTNGSTITLGRALNGGRQARFDRVEIMPANGAGAPMIFKSEIMRAAGNRGSMAQFPFPGSDGTYTLKVAYQDDPDGKTKFAVSVREPRPPAAPPAPAAPPTKTK